MEDLFNPECVGCTAFAVALNEALQLLSMVDFDANNVQLDIARYRRSNHRAITAAEEELSDSRPEPRFNSAAQLARRRIHRPADDQRCTLPDVRPTSPRPLRRRVGAT